jgi:transcription-repair coupling factor (superfamily II helicase)
LHGEAERLIEIARLRVEAIRIGIDEIVNLRREVRLAPVDLAQSQEIRLQRLAPRAILRAAQGRLFLPVPASGDLLRYLLDFLVAMWPPPTDPDSTRNRP